MTGTTLPVTSTLSPLSFRHPRSFNTILNFYRTGKLHVADEMCVLAFNDDLDYWGIPDIYLETCCTYKFSTKREQVEEEMEAEASKLILDDVEDFGKGKMIPYSATTKERGKN